MKIKRNLANRNNYGIKRATSTIVYPVFHWTGNDGDSDESNANYFKNNIKNASAHAFVDDDSITVSVPANYVAYSVGVDLQDQKSPYASKGRKYAGKATNANTYNIEICDTVKDGKHIFTDSTLTNAIMYGRKIIKRYKLNPNNAIRHFDVTGKICPYPFVVDERMWKRFKKALKTSVTTSVEGVRVRKKPGNSCIVKKLPIKTKCTIDKVEYVNGIPYGYVKKHKGWISLVNTK